MRGETGAEQWDGGGAEEDVSGERVRWQQAWSEELLMSPPCQNLLRPRGRCPLDFRCMASPTAPPQAWVSPVEVIGTFKGLRRIDVTEVISAAFLLHRICTGGSVRTLGLIRENKRALMHDDRLRVVWLTLGRVPREQKMLKGHLESYITEYTLV